MSNTNAVEPPTGSERHGIGINLSRSQSDFLVSALTLAVVMMGVGVFILPFLWMVSTSLKPLEDLFLVPPVWIPNPPRWQNYVDATRSFPFWRYTFNTLVIAVVATVGKLLSGSLTGYAFARLRWPGRDMVFFVVLATIMLPSMVTLVPTYILFKTLGWLNSFLPLVVPFWFVSTPYSIFLIRQYYMTIPTELSEAARIDGASEFRIYWQIILPLSKPVFVALAVLSFVRHWNELLEPLIYLTRQDMLTLSIGLLRFRSEVATYYHLLMAASILALIPILVLFFLAQNFFIEGITLTGIKG
jgi:ABC-type glycerol-3-phosphate transport system permease component